MSRICPLDWPMYCSCHGKDRVDPEMGLLKNMIRRYLLEEAIGNATTVRTHDYDGVRQKLIDLGADKPDAKHSKTLLSGCAAQAPGACVLAAL